MAHFYGTLQGSRGGTTRCGTRSSGLTTVCASWSGAVQCRAYQQHRAPMMGGRLEDGPLEDWIEVRMVPWHGNGVTRTIYNGPIGEYS